VLVSECLGFSTPAAERLRGSCDLRLADLQRGQLLDGLADVDVLWVRLRHRIDGEVLDAGPNLRAIVTATTGTDHVDTEAARRRGVRVLSLRGHADRLRDVRGTAEHTLGLMLALLRHLPDAVEHCRAGGWNRDLFWGHELYGRTAGVVGYGRLGRLMSGYLRALDLPVLATDPNVPDDEIRAGGAEPVALDELLRRSEIVTLHATLDHSTAGLISERELSLMPPSALLVNTARGGLVDEGALLDALRSRRLAGAALDVLADESGDGSRPLLDYAREHAHLLITPHIGGATAESREKTENLMAEVLLEFLSAPDAA
jgi:D-3-phosphoglycerate dehydrogenase